MMLTEEIVSDATENPSTNAEPRVFSSTLLGRLGDVEIAWEEHNADEMRTIIADKMAKGITFFEVKDGSDPMRRRRKLTHIDQLSEEARAVSVPDADFMRMFEEGKATVGRRGRKPLETGGIIRDPAVAATTNTVATPPLQGG